MTAKSSSGGLRSVIDIRPGEHRIAGLMASYFFLVITSFWILKPLKKTLFIGYYASSGFVWGDWNWDAAQAEQVAKVLNMGVAMVAAIVFSVLAVRLRREQLSYVFTIFFIVSYGIFAWALNEPSGPTVWSFYLFGDLFSTLMVATFFAFLNDSVSSGAAKRLYGVIGFGGVVGGVFGSSAVAVWITTLSLQSWLGIATGIAGLILFIAWAAARELAKGALSVEEEAAAAKEEGGGHSETSDETPGPLDGIRRVFGSGYLLSIVAIVGLYELASTVLDFQFTSAMIEFSANEEARNQNFATVFAVTNWLSMAVQLFATSFIMQRFGLAIALMVLPGAIALASMGFAWMPSLWTGGLLNTADNGFSYSINQSAKETLYVPTTKAEKYQAKAFIDMFVQRFAKALGVGLSLFVTSHFSGVDGLRSLSFMVLPVLAVWVFASVYAGKRFKQLESES